MELEQVLKKILSLRVDDSSSELIESLILQYPQWAEQITECWDMHRDLYRATKGYQDRFPGDLDAYEILSEVDRGGMGIVYRAKHKQLNRIVALKVIRSGRLADGNEIARFRREAQIAAQLVHPGIVPIFEVGQGKSTVYFTMAFVEGIPLRDWGCSPGISISSKVRLIHQVTQALEYAHQQGVAHRDIKPTNILIDTDGNPILIDFGLAKLTHGDTELTQSGATIGTPAYMAPEQIQLHRNNDYRLSDIYSLGAVLYFLLVGRPPFVGPTSFDVMLQLKDRQPTSPSRLNRRVDRELDAICLRAMEKDPLQRYPSAEAFGNDLAVWLDGGAIASPPKSIWGWSIRWWKQEPGLVAHVVSITSVMLIVLLSHGLGYSQSHLMSQSTLLTLWLMLCFPLQQWVFRSIDPTLPAVIWGLADTLFVTWLIANADEPRSLLLVAYPLLITASALFYRTRFVILMTLACILTFWSLSFLVLDVSLARTDFRIIFTCVLLVQCLTLTSLIHKVRNLFTYRQR
jgi:serine/threonine-protein kinase